MKFNLRKAKAIEKSIAQELNLMSFNADVVINKFTDEPELEIASYATELQEQIKTKTNLIDAMYAIRKLIAKANTSSENEFGISVSDVLAEIEIQKNKNKIYQEVIAAGARKTAKEIEKRLADIKNTENTDKNYYSNNSILTSCIDAEYIDGAKYNLKSSKRLIQKYNDTLLALNVGTVIDLPKVHVDTLESVGII